MSGNLVDRFFEDTAAKKANPTVARAESNAPISPNLVDQFFMRQGGPAPTGGLKPDEATLRRQWGIPEPEPKPGEIGGPMPQTLFPQEATPGHKVSGPTGDLKTDIPRMAGTAVGNAVAGLGSLPNLAAQGVDYVGGLIGKEPGAQKAIENVRLGGAQVFPTYERAQDILYGGTGGTEYRPSSWAGRRLMDALTGAVGGGMSGPVRAVLPSAAGSATGGAAAELVPDHPLAAAFLGSIPGAYVGAAVPNTAQRLAGMAFGSPKTEPYSAFTRLGLPTELTGTTTGLAGPVYAEKLAARMPGSEGKIADARSRLVDAWQGKLEDTAARLGSAASPTDVGIKLQREASGWVNQFKDRSKELWNDFRGTVPSETPTKTANFSAAINDVLREFPDAPNLASALQPPMAGKLRGALSADTAPPSAPAARVSSLVDETGFPITVGPSEAEMASYLDAVRKSGTLPWQAVQSIRSRLGEMLEGAQPIEGMSLSAVKRLYGALTEDMKAGAAAVSPEAVSKFHAANAATAAGHDLLDKFITPVIQAQTPEQAAQFAYGLSREGGSRLGALTFNLPGAAGDLGAYALRNMATNTQSPTALSQALLGRRPALSAEAQNVLFPDAGVRSNIADLATTGNMMRPFERDLAASPTATHEARGIQRLLTAVELGKEGEKLGGRTGQLVGLAGGLAAPEAIGKLAQWTALNPKVAAYYATPPYMQMEVPSRLSRLMLAQPAATNRSSP